MWRRKKGVRRFLCSLSAAGVMALAMPKDALASGIPVYDIASWTQLVQQVLLYKEQLEQMQRMVRDSELNLENLDMSWAEEYEETVENLIEIVGEVEGIASSYEDLYEQIEEVYPDWWATNGSERERMFRDRLGQWLDEARKNDTRTAYLAAKAIDALPEQQMRVGEILTTSAGASGNLAAIQAGNELIGHVTSQLGTLIGVISSYNEQQALQSTTERSEREHAMKLMQERFEGFGKAPEQLTVVDENRG